MFLVLKLNPGVQMKNIRIKALLGYLSLILPCKGKKITLKITILAA